MSAVRVILIAAAVCLATPATAAEFRRAPNALKPPDPRQDPPPQKIAVRPSRPYS